MRKISLLKICLSGAATVGLVTGAASPVLAQDHSSEENAQQGQPSSGSEIIVTARKRNERLSDVPETITAFSSEALTKAGIANVDDIGRQLPNVVLNRRGDNEPNAVIRGVGGFGNTQGVGFYIDDVRNVTDQSARLIDLERVEVLKGPQGTLYGGSSIGGAIKFVTKKPSYDGIEGHVTVEGGGQEILNLEGAVNIPITDGTAAVRISAYADSNGGYLTNPLIVDTRPDESKEYGVRGTLRLNPGENTEILATLRYIRMNNGGYPYYPTSGPSDYSFVSPGITNGFNRKQVLGGIVSLNHDFDFATFTSLSSYTRRENRILWDFSLTGDPATSVVASQDDPVVSNVVTQEFRLASNGDGPLSWLAGLYYSSYSNYDLLSQVDLFFGVPVIGDPNVPDFYDTKTMQRTYAGFANIGYKAGGFEANVGARLDHSTFKGTDNATGQTGKIDKTIVLPKLSLAYKPSRDLMIYASLAKGYEPGKVPVYGDGAFQPYKAETSLNYEVGVKGEAFDRLFQYELSGFYITYKDRQFETRVNENGIIVEKIVNVGDSESYGVEFSGTLRPTDHLTISGSAGYLHSTWKNGIYDLVDVSGNRTPNAPRFTGTLNADYSHPVSDRLKIGLRADIVHNSGFYWDIPNRTQQEDYNLVGFRLSLADIDDRWELAARLVNAFNKKYNYEYQDQINSEIDPVTGACNLCSNARIGQPRLYTVSFSYKF
ncbi:TonB-dependent receptor [Rhizorhabdus wittichii]|uniref:TonB-dependent receptor n=1 Tax=Rhizorhabdus wittichii TaxID=160791 RepID=UPI0002DF10E2|nr:TonB-dependent receptor [Rhizorhabdus wittichii]